MQILAIDPGQKRIGLALADGAVRLARPLGVLVRASKADDFARIARIVQEHGVGLIVVGSAVDAQGAAGERARTSARWARALAAALGAAAPGETAAGLAVVLWDERFSTVSAHAIRQAQGKRGPQVDIDAVAAAVILQAFLDHAESVSADPVGGV